MDVILYAGKFVAFSMAGGFIAGVIIRGILRFKLLPDKVASALKSLLFALSFFLGVVGFLLSPFMFFLERELPPALMICYVLLPGIAWFGWRLLNSGDGSLVKQLIGNGLLVGAAMPFIVVGYAGCEFFYIHGS